MSVELNGRHPNDLPDKITIDEILLELQDTKKFDINLLNLQQRIDGQIWRGDDKSWFEWVEQGDVKICEIVYPSEKIDIFDFNESVSKMKLTSVKETTYNVVRYPMRLSVKFNEEIPTRYDKPKKKLMGLWKSDDINFLMSERKWSNFITENSKIINEVGEVYLRLKDYLGPDFIQGQLSYTNFDIDLIISRCKIIM